MCVDIPRRVASRRVMTTATASASCLVFGGDGSRKTMVTNRLVDDALMKTTRSGDYDVSGRRSAVVEVR